MILVADVGGTKSRLAVFATDGQRLEMLCDETYPSGEFGSLHDVLAHFISQHDVRARVACLGVAGPCQEGRARITNLPWMVDAEQIRDTLRWDHVFLINDLVAVAYALPLLEDDDLENLHEGRPANGNRAVIAAGTGLGQAGSFWNGTTHEPFPSEGGHASFAPGNEWEAELLLDLKSSYDHVSWERVLSGPGLVRIYQLLHRQNPGKASPRIASQADLDASAISAAGMTGECPVCARALDLFVSLYGAEAGNLALKLMATGGVYLAGGIAPKILQKLKDGSFIKAFTAKGRMQPLLEEIPIRVITNERSPLLGAARYAILQGGDPL